MNKIIWGKLVGSDEEGAIPVITIDVELVNDLVLINFYAETHLGSPGGKSSVQLRSNMELLRKATDRVNALILRAKEELVRSETKTVESAFNDIAEWAKSGCAYFSEREGEVEDLKEQIEMIRNLFTKITEQGLNSVAIDMKKADRGIMY